MVLISWVKTGKNPPAPGGWPNADESDGRRDILSGESKHGLYGVCYSNPLDSWPLGFNHMFIKHISPPLPPHTCKKSLFLAWAAPLSVFYHINIFTSCACVEPRTLRTTDLQLHPDHTETMIVDPAGIYSNGDSFTAKAEPLQPNYSRHFDPDIVFYFLSFFFCRAETENTHIK